MVQPAWHAACACVRKQRSFARPLARSLARTFCSLYCCCEPNTEDSASLMMEPTSSGAKPACRGSAAQQQRVQA